MEKSSEQIIRLADQVLGGIPITPEDAQQLFQAEGSDVFLLFAMADKIREHFTGKCVDLCSVINGRCGNCSENCAFCAQSTRNRNKSEVHPLLSEDELVRLAIQREKAGAVHTDIATNGRGFKGDEKDFQTIIRAFNRIKKVTRLRLCACLGTLTPSAAEALAACGVERYNLNLQTSEDYFSHVITSHTYQERVNTILYAKEAGMEICSGIVMGMGETPAQRFDLAFLLKKLDVDSVPMNVLIPIKGTPLENAAPLSPMEILKTFAVFRFILPDKNIRYAAGRETALGPLQPFGLTAGLNGMLIGDCLTVKGADKNRDVEMLKSLGLAPASLQNL